MCDFDSASNPKRVDTGENDLPTRRKLLSLMNDVSKVKKVVQDLQPPAQKVKKKAGIYKR